MPDYDLGTARGRITIDASGAVSGAAQANAAQKSIQGEAGRTAASATLIGGAMVGAGAAIAVGLGVAIKTAADFEKQISGIAAVSGATEAELEKVRKKALQLGADTSFSAGEAALAMEELVKAGISVDDVLNGAADAVVALAAAGEIELPEAATIAANAMNQFNLQASDMAHVADLIAGAANASAIDVSDFGLAMQQAGATANLVGLSFDDLALAIAAMGNAGIRGSDAGTSLKTFLANLQPTTEKQISLMRELGLVTEDGANQFFTAEGKIKSLTDIAGVLNTALSGMTEQQKALALETIFGSDAIRAAAIIAETGAPGFDKLAESMGKVTAEEVAAKRLDNFAGSLEQLKGSVETLLITIGDNFLGPLRTVVDLMTDWVNAIGELNPELVRLVSYGLAGASAALLLGGALILVHKYITSLGAALSGLQLAKLFLNPVGLVVLAVIALAAGIYLLWQRSEAFRDIVREIGRVLHDAFIDTWEWIQDNVVPILEDIYDVVVSDIIPALVDFGKSVQEIAEKVVGYLQDHVIDTFYALGEAVFAVVQRILVIVGFLSPVFRAVFSTVVTTVRTALEIVKGIVNGVLGFVEAVWRNFGDNIIRIVQNVWDIVVLIFETFMGFLRGFFQIIAGIFSGDWSKIWEGVQTVVETAINFVTGIIDAGLKSIKEAFDLVISAVRLAWDTFWLVIRNVVETTFNIVKTFISGSINNIIEFFREMPGRIGDALGDLLSTLLQAGTDLIQGLWNGMIYIWEALKDWIKQAPGKILSFFPNPLTVLKDIGKKIIEGLLNGMKDAWEGVSDWLGDRIPDIRLRKGPPAKDAKILIENGELIMQGLQDGLNNGWRKVQGQLKQFSGNISTTFGISDVRAMGGSSGSGGDSFSFHFTFGDLTTPEAAQAVRSAVMGEDVLRALTQAARAGRR